MLAIGYYISGIIGAVSVSILLLHFCMFAALSFMPPSGFSSGKNLSHDAKVESKSEPPPRIIFRIAAGAIAVVIVCGWILGGLTVFAGWCISKRKNRTFVLIMAGMNSIWIPYGTLLGIASFVALCDKDAKLDYPG